MKNKENKVTISIEKIDVNSINFEFVIMCILYFYIIFYFIINIC